MVEFTDRKSVGVWLKKRTRDEICVFDGLSATLVFPLLVFEPNWEAGNLPLLRLRAILTFLAHGQYDSKAIREAANASAEIVNCNVTPFSAAANFSLSSFADRLENGGVESALAVPLWSSHMPETVKEAWDLLKKNWLQDTETWGFWIDWYEGRLVGRDPDWPLWHEIVLIENDVWDAGSEEVAQAIRDIEAKLVSQRMPLAEDLALNPETGLFEVASRPIANAGLLSVTLSQVSDAVDDVVFEAANGLRDNSYDVRVLRRTIERYANDPQRIEVDMTSVAASLLRQIAVEDLPQSAANMALQQLVAQAAEGIRATHPEIAENRRLLREQARKGLSDEALEEIAEAGPLLEAISQDRLAEEVHDDILVLTDQMRAGPPLLSGVVREREGEQVRVGGRVARMLIILRQSPELVKKLAASSGFQGATIVVTLASLVQLFLKLF